MWIAIVVAVILLVAVAGWWIWNRNGRPAGETLVAAATDAPTEDVRGR